MLNITIILEFFSAFVLIHQQRFFCSLQAHLTVRKAAEFFLMRLRVVPTGTKGVLDPKELDKAIQEELAFNRLPFLVGSQFLMHSFFLKMLSTMTFLIN